MRHAARWRNWFGLIMGGVAALGSAGCLAYKVVSAPVKLAATTVIVAGETAGAVVTTTGKLVVSGVNTVGQMGSGGLEATAKLAQAGMVTFVDVSTGVVGRVPWKEGLTLAGAGAGARMELARRSVEVVRAGQVVFTSKRPAGDGAALVAGDVVRLSP